MSLSAVFAFDRDGTVDTGYGPVPVAWVAHLDERPDTKVIAIGNQDLVSEAGIHGLEWLAEELGHDVAVPSRVYRVKRVREWADREDAAAVHHVDDAHVDVEGVASHRPRPFVERFRGRFDLPDPAEVLTEPVGSGDESVM